MAESFLNRIQASYDDLTTLNIVTRVGKAKLNKTTDTYEYADDAQLLISNINLVKGDIDNTFDPNLIKNSAIMALHNAQVLKGHEIIQGNITALKELANLITEFGEPEEDDKTDAAPKNPK